jgi:hypothetical protein
MVGKECGQFTVVSASPFGVVNATWPLWVFSSAPLMKL